ncbi:hypothetical protein [Flavobacterium sp.]|uniref:hypothetical protein n=1 Tax=Flavobacterium sp. TaxID=239 RepID=UPI00374DB407
MTQLKYFTKEGNKYVMKKQYGFGLIVTLLLSGIAIVGIVNNKNGIAWFFGILAVLFLISVLLKHVIIDIDKNEISIKSALIAPAAVIPLNNIQNFELVRVRQYLITTNTYLNIYYRKGEKEKGATVSQGFTAKAMQNLANEIDEILDSNGHTRKI